LLQVINDILDFSKIEAGRLDLVCTVFDHSEVVGDAMKSLALRSHSKGLELLLHLSPEIPAALVGDPHRLRQVIINLVGNAIKFTDVGEVLLETTVLSQDDAHVELHYSVSDTGIGIPPEGQEHIFEAFEQLDGSSARRHGGTGLGLSVCRRLVEMMGGRIWVESEMGRGTTVHFTARFDVSARSAPDPVSTESLQGHSVLIVDDNAVHRHILREMLRTWRMNPVEAASGEEAIDALRTAHRAGQPLQLAIVDSRMPGMSGFAMAEQVQRDRDLSTTPMLMLGSGDGPGDVARCERLGIISHLMKPIKQSELLRAVTLTLGIASQERRQVVPTAFPQLPPLRVLLAEDSVTNQRLTISTLRRHGHQVEVADSGNMALDKLSAAEFDLVLMDVRMPKMDGLEATRIIRDRERLTGGHIPIIALTANAMRGDRERCLEAGMDGYLTKPMQPAELIAAISEVLVRRGMAVGEEGSSLASPGEPIDHAKNVSPRPAQRDIIDWELALQQAYDDEQVLFDLANDFLVESPKYLVQLRDALRQGDAQSAERAAHTLKGQFGIFGAPDAVALALYVEKRLQEGELEIAPLLKALEEESRKVGESLVQHMNSRPKETW
ncbi:MAG: response regulator, partial [Pirellulaceae bacterium]